MVFQHFLVFTLCILGVISSEAKVTSLCNSTKDEPNQICECAEENLNMWGLPSLRIDCTSRGLNSTNFEAEILPIYTEELNLAWNEFDNVPDLVSPTLRRLRLAYNKITSTDEKNFIYVANLTDLDLSWNGLEILSIGTFAELRFLTRLDLSGNNLKKISINSFSPLVSLEMLDLSWNPRLNESADIKDLDLFLSTGLPTKLKVLKIGHCNLNEIHLYHGSGLQELHISWNNLSTITDLPKYLKFIDLSGNPISVFRQALIPHLFQLEVMLLEDMPRLTTVEEYALFGFPNLKILSFQNSRALTLINPHAFGEKVVLNETDTHLEHLNLRGTALKRLNSSLAVAFQHLKLFDLTGLQLFCDCNLQWIQNLKIETGGQCHDPINLRGLKLLELSESQFECDNTPTWVSQLFNGLLILLLIVLCSAGIWLIILGLRPSHKKHNHKLGATSPYARITIEPNQVENYY